MSVPACHTVLAPVYALLEARTQNYSQVLEVRGKLEMMTKQRSEKSAEHHIDIDKEPLIGQTEDLKNSIFNLLVSVYQDESSDEGDDLMDDLLINGDDDDSASYNSEEESDEDNDQMVISESDG